MPQIASSSNLDGPLIAVQGVPPSSLLRAVVALTDEPASHTSNVPYRSLHLKGRFNKTQAILWLRFEQKHAAIVQSAPQ